MMMSHIDLNKEEFEIGQMCEWHPEALPTTRTKGWVEVSVVAQYFGEDSITDMGKDYSVLVRRSHCNNCDVREKDLLCWVRVQDLTKIIAST